MVDISFSLVKLITENGWKIKGSVLIMMGIFGSMFDLNRDGKMDAFERATEFAFLDQMNGEEDTSKTEFELSGLDASELEFMDAEERREALEEVGLDPDEYDF